MILSRTYYPNGELNTETGALCRTTTYLLNALDQRVQVNYVNGTDTQERYDFVGARVATIAQEARSTRI